MGSEGVATGGGNKSFGPKSRKRYVGRGIETGGGSEERRQVVASNRCEWGAAKRVDLSSSILREGNMACN